MTRFNAMLPHDDIAIVAGAHDALTAKLAQAAGFHGIWLGSFSLAAQKLLPDIGLITLTDMLGAVSSVAHTTTLPVIVDAEVGYGDHVNVAHAAEQLLHAGAAAICIEDNAPPKRSSLYSGFERDLLEISAMQRKIQSAIEARGHDDIAVIARTEALIAHHNCDEAVLRARAYAAAGADAVVIQASAWPDMERVCRMDLDVPIIAIPTMYPEVSRATLRHHGVRVAIYANQALRAAVHAIAHVLHDLAQGGWNPAVEQRLATVTEINALMRMPKALTWPDDVV